MDEVKLIWNENGECTFSIRDALTVILGFVDDQLKKPRSRIDQGFATAYSVVARHRDQLGDEQPQREIITIDSCSVCAGEGVPLGAPPCICKGVGTAAAELQGFREELYNSRMRMDTLETLLKRWHDASSKNFVVRSLVRSDLAEQTHEVLGLTPGSCGADNGDSSTEGLPGRHTSSWV